MQTKFSNAPLALAALAASASLAGCGINDIPTKQEIAKAKWADVQADYQRRSDLIPQLVGTVTGEAEQERAVLIGVTQARAKATSVTVDASTLTNPAAFQKFQQSQDELSGALGRLLAVKEAYPDMKSNEAFQDLMSQIEGSENRIAIARRDYNDAVRDYNTTLRVFPTILWAKTFYGSAQPMQLFGASAAAQTAPTVQFNFNGPQAGAPPGSTPPAAGNAATP